ncbi:ras-related and estrogen-regulated growth inhibitor-like protein isoform X2 [Mustelus asterias]
MVLHSKSGDSAALSSQRRVDMNVLILGADCVGKSEAVHTHDVSVEGTAIRFNIWDSLHRPGSEATPHPTEEQLSWADGCILVYSICDRGSFEVARQQLAHIQRALGQGRAPAVVLAGNKRDLSHRRAVPREEGRSLAQGAGCRFLEVSAAEGYQGAALAFRQLLELVREARAPAKRGIGLRGIVRSVSAALAGKRRVE